MKINMNSWHYRLIENFLDGDPSRSLCVYFWQVIFRIVMVTMMGGAIWGFFGFFALAIAEQNGWVIAGESSFLIKTMIVVFGAFVTAGCLALVGVLFCLIVYGVVKAILTVKELFNQWEQEKEEKNVLIAYIKAKKRKICPLIEFTVEDK